MTREELKQAVCDEIDRRRDDIIRVAQTMRAHPELGFKEYKTAALVRDTLAALDLPLREGLALTGVEGVLHGGKPGPGLCIIGELDALVVRDAPVHDPDTGAAHQCGHHIQISSMLGAAMGLVRSGVASSLAGVIHFLGVPAEEVIELEYRTGLMREGKITYPAGKQELIKQGYFDDINIAMMVHSQSCAPDAGIYFGSSSNAFQGKVVRYVGRPTHAGATPEDGINALNAACLGIMAIHAQRETFRDQDHCRVAPIIIKGGDVVNTIPDDVRMEMQVRGATIESLKDVSFKVDRALRAGGDAVGAKTIIENIPGYLPLIQDEALTAVAQENTRALIGEQGIRVGAFLGGSVDIGDVSHLMPVLHPFVGGNVGNIHTREFEVVDYDASAILSAKMLAMTAIDLLAEDAVTGRKIIGDYRPRLNKQTYLALMDEMGK